MQIKNYIFAAKIGFVVLSLLVLNAQALLAEAPEKSARAAYTDPNSTEAQDILWLARVLYSETKVREEQIIIAWVMRNRVESKFRGALSYKDVALSPAQFSGLWPSDLQYNLNMSREYGNTKDLAWVQALAIAQAVYFADESLRPISETTRHFYSPMAVTRDPNWATNKKPVVVLRSDTGAIRFAFYEGVK